MDQEKALEIEEIERLQCELQAQEDPVTLGRAPFAPSWMVVKRTAPFKYDGMPLSKMNILGCFSKLE